MKQLLLRFSFAAAITLAATALASSARAQEADQDPAPTAPQKPDSPAVPPQHANEAHMPASGESTTREAKLFRGNVVKEEGEVVLQDPVTKVIHKLNDVAKAKEYLGKAVKITGKFDSDSNTIYIEKIEPAS